jgi:hypothetical protein
MTGRNAFISTCLTGGMAEEKSQKGYDRSRPHAQFCAEKNIFQMLKS